MTTLHVIGAGGHAAVILDIIRKKYANALYSQVMVWADSYDPDKNQDVNGFRLAGHLDDAKAEIRRGDRFVIAVGDNTKREALYRMFSAYCSPCGPIIHPTAIFSNTKLGNGTVVMAGAIIETNVDIGAGVIVNTGATINHDCVLGNFAHICPGVNIAGNVKVGECTQIGIGSSVIQNVTIGDDITIGAGSVVINSLKENGAKYVGVPAFRVK